MTFNFLNQGQNTDITQVTPIDTFIDPVSKIRVSNPGNLIDTDFEYGLQPTKWETVEIINNTPAFFSKSGDTTISDITGVTTNAGTREITVTTAFPHLLDVGIPIRVAGTKSLTADGSYIINATPTPTTFTYLSRANQGETVSIFDLYTSIITGEFFQGSQISISDSEGITTDGTGPNSTLTVKTSNKHGFGLNTPFYFLNLNSTVSQEFEAQNSTSLSFDPTNSATAQTFDGSNTLIQTPIDISNSATSSDLQNSITGTNANDATITISIANGDEDNWGALVLGDPLYYSVSVGSGYFQANPRGIVFIKDVSFVNPANNTATFQVSSLPDGDPLPIVSNMTGYFKIADQARTFAGNNVDPATQIDVTLIEETPIEFDGANVGYPGVLEQGETPPTTVARVQGYSGTNILVFAAEGELDYYVGAMLKYTTDTTSPDELVSGNTYFVTAIAEGISAGFYDMSIAEIPGGDPINFTTTGSGVEEFARIGVSLDKDIFHIKDSNFAEGDMLEYSYPASGRIVYDTDEAKDYFFVETAYDAHNYKLADALYNPITATGGDVISETFEDGKLFKTHTFNTSGTLSVETVGNTNGTFQYIVEADGSNPQQFDEAGGLYDDTTFDNPSATNGLVLRIVGPESPFKYLSIQNSAQAGWTSGDNGGISTTARSFASGSLNFTDALNHARSNGGRLPTLEEVLNNATAGSGSGYDNQDIWTCTHAGDPNFHYVAAGRTNSDRYEGIRLEPNTASHEVRVVFDDDLNRADPVLLNDSVIADWQTSVGITNQYVAPPSFTSETDYTIALNNTNTLSNIGPLDASEHGVRGTGRVKIKYDVTPTNPDYIAASGGTVNQTNIAGTQYAIHTFNSPGTYFFDVSSAPAGASIEYLIVGGGGGGGGTQGTNSSGGGGGGGAGGMVEGTFVPNTQSYPVIVGSGGAAGNGTSDATGNGGDGGDSSVFGITADGGGGGGWGFDATPRDGRPGGSGGGSGGGDSTGQSGGASTQTSPAGGTGYGNRGGRNTTTYGDFGGGGGGAGGQGEDVVDGSASSTFFGAGKGGPGRQNSITGTSTYYAAGGGGGGNQTAVPADSGEGGTGGGGRGGIDGPGQDATGIGSGGGGGGDANQNAGKGTAGIVIIRYPIG